MLVDPWAPPAVAVTVPSWLVVPAVKMPSAEIVPRLGGSMVQCTADSGRSTLAPPAVAATLSCWVSPLPRSAVAGDTVSEDSAETTRNGTVERARPAVIVSTPVPECEPTCSDFPCTVANDRGDTESETGSRAGLLDASTAYAGTSTSVSFNTVSGFP